MVDDAASAATHPPFADVLRRARLAAGLTQEQLAERAGLSARGVSDLERGARTRPQRDTLTMLADGLGLTGPERQAFLATARRAAVPRTPPAQRRSPQPALAFPGAPLPTRLDRFVGREQDIAALAALLRDPAVRLVTLTGMGGIGKTRLALELAHHLAEAFADGVVFVDLSPITNPELVLPTIAQALGLRDPGDQPLPALVTTALQGRELLLVVDNCEQILGAATDLAALLAVCPSLTMLATSREALRLRGEREWPVAPLPLPPAERPVPPEALLLSPAVALFVARAEASDPRFTLSVENATAVAAICQHLEGVPLALELAAARIKLLRAEELAERLQHPLPLLTGGARDAPVRQRTLRDTLAWSYDLLVSDEQALFRRLGVFVGGWTLEAAEAVLAADTVEGLSSLLDKSLIRREDGGSAVRYSMFETVREFAHDQLVAHGEDRALQLAHATYFLALAERSTAPVRSGDQQRWLPLLDAEHPNIRQAFATFDDIGDDVSSLRLATALQWFWYMHAREGLPRFERVLERYEEPTALRAAALPAAAMQAYACGAYDQADQWLDEGEALAHALGERLLLAQCAMVRGAVAEHRGDEVGAEQAFACGLEIAQEIGADWLIGELLANLADAAYRRGELDLAERQSRAALSALQQTGNAFMESMAFVCLAQVALARGAVGQAVAALAQSLEIAEAIESRLNRANTIAGAAAVCAAQGRWEQAVRLLGAADAERERLGQPRLPNFGLWTQTLEAVRSSLTAEAYDHEWVEGQAFSVGEAVATVYALLAEIAPSEGSQPYDQSVRSQSAR